jgi:hypothetical protein
VDHPEDQSAMIVSGMDKERKENQTAIISGASLLLLSRSLSLYHNEGKIEVMHF